MFPFLASKIFLKKTNFSIKTEKLIISQFPIYFFYWLAKCRTIDNQAFTPLIDIFTSGNVIISPKRMLHSFGVNSPMPDAG